MKRFAYPMAAALSSLALVLAVQAARAMPRQVQAGKNRLRMSIVGEGSPTVIFDTFGPANLEIWNRVQPAVSRFARTVSYDHGGYWGSEPGPKPRDARQIVRELREALMAANLQPPYVLVGYSFGGPYMRVFAGMYPVEVAGMVFVDPTQEDFMVWLEKAFPPFAEISNRHMAAQDEVANRWVSMDLARDSRLPEVPMALITGTKCHDQLTRWVMPRWLAAHKDWLATHPHARHIITTNSGHNILLNEPELVMQAIQGVIAGRNSNQE